MGWSVYTQHMSNEKEHVHIIRYEDLLQRPVEVTSGVFNSLCVSSDTRLVEKVVEKNSFKVQSGGRKPGEEDPGSGHRKGVSGDWKHHFSQEGLDVFLEVAAESLAAWGYLDKE